MSGEGNESRREALAGVRVRRLRNVSRLEERNDRVSDGQMETGIPLRIMISFRVNETRNRADV